MLALFVACDPPAPASDLSGDGKGGNNPTNPTPTNIGAFDAVVFASTIQPILDTAEGKGCTSAACHGSPTAPNGFALTRNAAPGSKEIAANMAAVVARCSTSVPDQSAFYQNASHRHGNGASALVSQQQAIQILTWIQHAAPATPPPIDPPPAGNLDAGTTPSTDGAPPTGGTGSACISADKFNVGLFTTQIQPLLFGQIDYNAPPGQPVSNVGCARSSCHGTDRGPGTLYISQTNTPQQNLQSFGCYINAQAPSASPVLACPLNQAGCPKTPHPGQNVFRDPTDRNYQRLLSFLYATNGVNNPLDFAFFARAIDPLFHDPANGGIAAGNRTCADAVQCHGVQGPGGVPANLSDLGMLTSATNKDSIGVDYWQAANFANFLQPQGSDLFLFPTDLTSDVNQPFATGLHHPGGINFGVDSNQAAASDQAKAVLDWTGGLRPDQDGNVLNWLVAGTYSAAQVTQNTTIGDETKLAPTIFDPDGAFQFNNGQWDTNLSASKFVDLNKSFPGNAGAGRIAYAAAYLMNTTAADLQSVLVTVNSPNIVLMYIDGHPVAQSAGNNQAATAITTLPAFTTTHPSTRILLKVLQGPNDQQFGFSFSLKSQQNIALSNVSGELIYRMDAQGGF